MVTGMADTDLVIDEAPGKFEGVLSSVKSL